MKKEVTVIGAAIMDIHAGPVPGDLFSKGSVPADRMCISFGGDALNEAVVLSGLGVKTEIISVIGKDETGQSVLKNLRDNNVATEKITIEDGLTTGMNIVLNDDEGERYFITNPYSSLRKLSLEHILPHIDDAADIVCFASMFVSPMLDIENMGVLFGKIKEKPERILIADMTTAKKGETIKDIAPLFEFIDYIIPNEHEAALLTGGKTPEESLEIFAQNGAKNVIIKCGKKGCIYYSDGQKGEVSTRKVKVVDTTGAGDSFVAGFTYGLMNNMSIDDACKKGNEVAAKIIGKTGTQA
ncbi:carbohydrate kinase family protein [Butyrivibrio sp. INlla16]|uniref:carbohydrate kinase family protein n=1 Tax=Butyrivibrio sp. INlla16 TaxID=1520807 RepID=UPI00088087C2|nr:carbohydrate kinase family protein [Butyrivibrio sp. INlla16]SDB24449.1 Sugar or nucleoside kinase, ribokinase family [Butyrivibrio sp. INlla16]